ncbi:alkane 1-monooxygenase [Subsaximicrobium wynnwilliamsii]|uniref:Alkane 1-monooxygenase n=1 Tax=Subsaximicrobium wynnwilliamsii TaxID=291179 RepID=A0A5C6ZFJ5_9FLAO|nr:alkane 1-monooxygenase [Subsaximicrobium wynnwilliamsii]TXD82625.1 alkane 1-monooxygenase [Subsaximicrobium wynnwilliamsii]TXD88360.1 alkane 1-monooxygenase [Subsaximicrobium wynnwilliamsii]TXE02287.1 alkane 1-monooxygenase [Subsaximicrobium wynnwilliamsii]
MKDLKYLAAFSIPLVAFISLYFKGAFVFLTPVYAFILIPIFELIFTVDPKNLSSEEHNARLKRKVFDWLLYLNLPIVYVLIGFGIYQITQQPLATYEIVGIVISVGIVLGVNGINVAHELGHRHTTNERFLGKALLLPALYMHFFIEHNYGHHLHAATAEDPATARYNQTVYGFWFTSVFRQYVNAWSIQKTLLKNSGRPFLSLKNDMFWYSILQLVYLAMCFLFFGKMALIFVISAAIVGILLLETVNYIEHYGLLRLKTKSGRYERVQEMHSWNSNHVIGRIVLYELTRHSDHHFKSTKKYQILDCHDESPQMPFGYPTSMVLAMVPPIWFKIMNKRVPRQMLLN